jgi:hypothetical protein
MEQVKNIIADQLSKLPKKILTYLLIFFAWLYISHQIRDFKDSNMANRKYLQLIKTTADSTLKNQAVICENQKRMDENSKKRFDEVNLNISEISQKQRIVIRAQTALTQKACDQVNDIYKQMRLDQSLKDKYKMDKEDGSYIIVNDSTTNPNL